MDALARAAADHPEAPAVVAGRRTVTYGELDAAARGVADMIRRSGAIADHPVAFWGDRTPETIAAVWGIPRAGVAAVPVDPRMTPSAAMAATRSVGVRGLWTPPERGLERLVEAGAPEASGPTGGYVVLTSGSEGRPKGVVIETTNIDASVTASGRRLGHGHGDAWLCVLPLFHVGGLAILWRQAAAAAPVVLHEQFDADLAATALGEVAFASFVPVMLRRVLAGTETTSSRLRAVLIGGAAADRGLLEAARAAGIPALPTYGMTETASQIATPRPSDPLDGTVGTAMDGAEIRVVARGEAVVGEEGRIEVRGPMVSPGYAGEPRRSGEWFTTGDVGVLDAAGRLEVRGRADAVIVTGGENVHPTAVEAALRAIPGVVDAVVRGESDAEWGQIVAAEVETGLDLADLEQAVRDLPSPMRPRLWRVVDRIERKLDG